MAVWQYEGRELRVVVLRAQIFVIQRFKHKVMQVLVHYCYEIVESNTSKRFRSIILYIFEFVHSPISCRLNYIASI